MNCIVIPMPRRASPRRCRPDPLIEPAFAPAMPMLDLIAMARIEGHVPWPRKGGERQAVSEDASPSALPGISPAGGEIGR